MRPIKLESIWIKQDSNQVKYLLKLICQNRHSKISRFYLSMYVEALFAYRKVRYGGFHYNYVCQKKFVHTNINPPAEVMVRIFDYEKNLYLREERKERETLWPHFHLLNTSACWNSYYYRERRSRIFKVEISPPEKQEKDLIIHEDPVFKALIELARMSQEKWCERNVHYAGDR